VERWITDRPVLREFSSRAIVKSADRMVGIIKGILAYFYVKMRPELRDSLMLKILSIEGMRNVMHEIDSRWFEIERVLIGFPREEKYRRLAEIIVDLLKKSGVKFQINRVVLPMCPLSTPPEGGEDHPIDTIPVPTPTPVPMPTPPGTGGGMPGEQPRGKTKKKEGEGSGKGEKKEKEKKKDKGGKDKEEKREVEGLDRVPSPEELDDRTVEEFLRYLAKKYQNPEEVEKWARAIKKLREKGSKTKSRGRKPKEAPKDFAYSPRGIMIASDPLEVKVFVYEVIADEIYNRIYPPTREEELCLRMGSRKWKEEDGVENMDVVATINRHGVVIPEVTLQAPRVVRKFIGERVGRRPIPFIVSIDTSGSVGEPTGSLTNPCDHEIVMFFALLKYAMRMRFPIGLTLWTGEVYYHQDPTYNYAKLKRDIIRMWTTGGTAIDKAIAKAVANPDVPVIMITDGEVTDNALLPCENVVFFLVERKPDDEIYRMFVEKYGKDRVIPVPDVRKLPVVVLKWMSKRFTMKVK